MPLDSNNVNKLLSIIVPCFNEEDAVPIFFSEAEKAVSGICNKGISSEYIFIDDGSSDNTLQMIKNLTDVTDVNVMVKFISFSRNFGKEAAILAGLKAALGDYIVIMDADLQDPPEMLPEMIDILLSGTYNCVATRRVDRSGEPYLRSFFSRAFYSLINKISDVEIMDGARDYRMFTRQVASSVLSINEYNRFSKGIFSWVGFNTKWLEYENKNRSAGSTKWSFKKLVFYALEGIFAFSTFPLRLITCFGIFMAAFSSAALMFIVVKTLAFGDPVAGWPSMICIILFLNGGQFIALGLLGEYVAKMYMEVKNRPAYVVKEDNIK